MLWITIVIVSVSVSSCTYFRPNMAKVQDKIDERVRELTSGSKLAAERAAKEVSKAKSMMMTANVPTNGFDAITMNRPSFDIATNSLDNAERALDVTVDQTRRTENLIGKPIIDQTPVIEALLSENKSIREAAQAKEHSRELQEQKWRAKVEELEKKLIDYGTKYEEERNEKITSWFKWSALILAIIGIPTALVILCPALIPGIVSAFPALTKIFGVPVSLAKNVVKGVGDVRWQLKQQMEFEKQAKAAAADNDGAFSEKLYTAEEVLNLLNNKLANKLDTNDKKIIDHFRQHYDV